jgi:acetyl esterase/lipase
VPPRAERLARRGVNRTRALLLATAVPLLIVLGLLVSALAGAGHDEARLRRPATEGAFAAPGAERIDVGRGARGAAIFRGRESAGSVVIFLHGWTATDPRIYGPWITHLVRRGATVIYPAYQAPPFTDVARPLANVLSAVRAALADVAVAPGRLAVVGEAEGGALAADYAMSARSAGLPAPAAVFSVYPRGMLHGTGVRLPTVSTRRIAAGTRILILAPARDRRAGDRAARQILRSSTRVHATVRVMRDPRVEDQSAPQRSEPAAQHAFWAPLDRLVAVTG